MSQDPYGRFSSSMESIIRSSERMNSIVNPIQKISSVLEAAVFSRKLIPDYIWATSKLDFSINNIAHKASAQFNSFDSIHKMANGLGLNWKNLLIVNGGIKYTQLDLSGISELTKQIQYDLASKIIDLDSSPAVVFKAFQEIREYGNFEINELIPSEDEVPLEIKHAQTVSELDARTLKWYLEWIIIIYWVSQMLLSIHAEFFAKESLDSIKQGASISQVKKTARLAVGSKFDESALKLLRVTTAQNVRLRMLPAMNAKILFEMHKFQILHVLDKSNRDWLMVEVEIGEEKTIGWVSRRYSSHLH